MCEGCGTLIRNMNSYCCWHLYYGGHKFNNYGIASPVQVPPMFKTRLRELMQSHPNGIALKFFNDAFSKRFHHFIAFRNWGFESLEGMITSVQDILIVHNDTTRNIKMVKRAPPRERSECKKVKGDASSINWYSLGHRRGCSISLISDEKVKGEMGGVAFVLRWNLLIKDQAFCPLWGGRPQGYKLDTETEGCRNPA